MIKKIKIPIRTCIGCNAKKPKKEMIRIVIDTFGNCEIDPSGKKSGRGFYICYNINCVDLAVKNKKFNRYMDIKESKILVEQIEKKIKNTKNIDKINIEKTNNLLQ